MGFRNEVKERLAVVEDKLDQILGLLATSDNLKSQNSELFDRLMSIDWEKYAGLSPDIYNRHNQDKSTETVMSPTQDEDIIGEILSDEDLGK